MNKILLLVSVIVCATGMSYAQINPAPAQPACFEIKNGMYLRDTDAKTNGEVTKLQNFLREQGFLIVPATGFYGNTTVRAVRQFQAANGIGQSGATGPKTRELIIKNTCIRKLVPREVFISSNISELDNVTTTQIKPLSDQHAGIKIDAFDSKTKTVSVTCIPPKNFNKGGYWYVFFGDGTNKTNMYEHITPHESGGLNVGAMLDSVDVDFKIKQFSHTYKQEGLFNVMCVPLAYDPKAEKYKVTAFLDQSPYKAITQIRAGEQTAAGVLKLSVNRTSGKIPFDLNASCSFLGKPKIPISLIQMRIDDRNPTTIDFLNLGHLASIPERRTSDLLYNFATTSLPFDTKVVYQNKFFPENTLDNELFAFMQTGPKPQSKNEIFDYLFLGEKSILCHAKYIDGSVETQKVDINFTR